MGVKRKRGRQQSRVGTNWVPPRLSATSKLAARGFVIPRAYFRAVVRLKKALLPCEPRTRDTRGNASRTTEPFQTRALRNVRPDVLEPTRKIVSGKLEHFRAAISIARHPLADVEVDVPADLKAAVDGVSRMRHGVSAWRAHQLGILRELAESPFLVQMSARIMDLALPHVRWAVGPGAHPALIMVFIDALEWPDVHFAYRHYVVGWPVVGWPADTGLYRHRSVKEMARDAREYVHPDRLARTSRASNSRLAASMQHGFRMASQQADASRLAAYAASHEASLKEVHVLTLSQEGSAQSFHSHAQYPPTSPNVTKRGNNCPLKGPLTIHT